MTDKQTMQALGDEILNKLTNRAPLNKNDLHQFCQISTALSRQMVLFFGTFILYILVIIILVLIAQVYSLRADKLILCFTISGWLTFILLPYFQKNNHYFEILERFYCRHCNSSFSDKDITNILHEDSCPHCAGIKPLLVMGFEKIEPIVSEKFSSNTPDVKSQLADLPEQVFRNRVDHLQELYWKRAGWDLLILIFGGLIAPIVFGLIVSIQPANEWRDLLAIIALISICAWLLLRFRRSESLRFNHVVLTCQSCGKDIPLPVAERNTSCQHCNRNFFVPEKWNES